MARPKNPQRRADLLAAAAEVVQRQGIAGTTLRPLATELGVAPRTLLYHFDSKENLLVEVLLRLRHGQPDITRILSDSSCAEHDPAERLTDAVRLLWREAQQAEVRPFLALYFELTALAIRNPDQYRPLLGDIDREWVESITSFLQGSGAAAEEARTIADALLIGYRGALCFALATDRWDSAETSITALMDDIRTRLSVLSGGWPD